MTHKIENKRKRKKQTNTFKLAEMISCYRFKRSWISKKENFLLIAKFMDSQERVLRNAKTANSR